MVVYVILCCLGLLILITGIVFFYGVRGTRNYQVRLGRWTINHEGLGGIMFFIGIVLVLTFLIHAVKPLIVQMR